MPSARPGAVLQRDDLAGRVPDHRVLLPVLVRQLSRPAGDDAVVVDAERVRPGVPGESREQRGLAVGRPAHGLALSRDDQRGGHLAAVVDRVPVGHVSLLQAPVRAFQHGHATGFPAERKRAFLLVVEQAEDDAVVVHAVGLRGDVARQHSEIDCACRLPALPQDRVLRGRAVLAVGEADDVAAIVQRLRLNLHRVGPRRLEDPGARRAGGRCLSPFGVALVEPAKSRLASQTPPSPTGSDADAVSNLVALCMSTLLAAVANEPRVRVGSARHDAPGRPTSVAQREQFLTVRQGSGRRPIQPVGHSEHVAR